MSAPTKEQIRELILTNDRIVERAIIVLYNRQTSGEQRAGMTRERNSRGFSSSDASTGTYMAKWIMSGKRLTGKYIDRARKMALTYIGQLVEEAELKAARQLQSRLANNEVQVVGPVVDADRANLQASLDAAMAAARGG